MEVYSCYACTYAVPSVDFNISCKYNLKRPVNNLNTKDSFFRV